MFGTGYMTKMVAISIYGKNLNLLLQSHMANWFGLWYVAFGGGGELVLQSLYQQSHLANWFGISYVAFMGGGGGGG